MHYEYAIDPSCLIRDYKTFLYIIEKFGFSKGRLVAKFPKQWKKIIIESSRHFSEMDKKKRTAILNNVDIFLNSGREYNNTQSWFENALFAHENKPFHGIITNEKINENPFILSEEDLEEHRKHERFVVPYEIKMPKTPQGFKNATNILLNNAREVIFIDPYFLPPKNETSKRYIDAAEAMISNITKSNTELKYFCSASLKGETIEFRTQKLKDHIRKLNLPSGMTLKVILLNKDDMFSNHNRYVLTDRGGIKFPWGLDCLKGKNDEINIMSENTYIDVYSIFSNVPKHLIADEIKIPNNT